MEPTNKTTVLKSDFPPQAEILSFEDTRVAFASKSDNDLRKAYYLFKLVSSQSLMVLGKHASTLALKLNLPIKGIIKKTIFNQFCGGETIEECASTTKILDAYNIGTILDYSVEGKENEAEFESGFQEILRTVETADNNPHIPFCVFKVSGLCRNTLLEKISAGKDLTEAESAAFQRLKQRVDAISKRAEAANTPIFFDAEESWLQDAIDNLAMEMMDKYNRDRAIVYNTLQMYRHDRMAHLVLAQAKAEENGFFYGVKLVRGAYMEKERVRAEEKGYNSPIQPDKAATDRDYDAAILFCLSHLNNVYFCAGTHNENSSLLLAAEMDRLEIDRNDERIFFAQLYGMSDHISFNLSKASFNVAKYVPYGPVKDVMPYLIRRAEENTSVQGQTGRELNLITKEIKRRKKS
ncbi:MAG TPA: proline dehydrogenase family protein [Cryomorphaceae bacterium]|nr:proline dehydrogenase family protein [Cryomorphaceae bacterium]